MWNDFINRHQTTIEVIGYAAIVAAIVAGFFVLAFFVSDKQKSYTNSVEVKTCIQQLVVYKADTPVEVAEQICERIWK